MFQSDVCSIFIEFIFVMQQDTYQGSIRRARSSFNRLYVLHIHLSLNLNHGDVGFHTAWYSYGCTSPTWRNSAFELSFLMAFEIILQCMNTWRKFRTYRDVQSQTLNTLYWDGIMYMFGVILLTTTNVAVIAAAPIASIPALETAQVAIHSVLASRIFFNLKECDERIRGGGAEPDISLDTLRYRSLSVGTSLSRVEHSVT